jgi:Methyltransferase FkbM domain
MMKPKRKPSCVTVAVLAIGALVLSRTMILPDGTPKQGDTSRNEAAAKEAAANAGQVKEWRQSVRDLCTNAKSAADVKAVERKQMSGFQLPLPTDESKPQPRDDSSVKVCQNVVMDYGANIGDTGGHVLNSGMAWCDRQSDLQTATNPYLFNVIKHNFEFATARNPMVVAIEGLMEEQTKHLKSSAPLGPEDYCYYGIEGNPTFTKRLQGIEDVVMAMKPRPVEHMHFFTESVGAGEDGMTKLYLDTINTEVNFWGSSLMKEHGDVQKSAAGGDVEKQAVPVMGYTIGTLMRKTLRALDPLATEAEKKGSHFILKMDIEGGEYIVLPREAKDGTLCEYIKMGNAVDVYVEWHGASAFGGNHGDPRLAEGEAAKKTLEDCGVKFRILDPTWSR